MSISDKEFYNLTISINKALNPMEAPLKIKHARFIIISSHRTKEGKSFWAIATRQPLMEHQFTAWKFCHLLHKILREGHASCIRHTQSHKKMILEMGKLWGHLQDGVGHCIQSYSKLLVTKLDFHEKNANIPGGLIIDFREIEKYSGEDINVNFQLCVEVFDYMDDILDLQSKVFASINTFRMSSMTPQGQCRLAPLITLIQDSNPLYDLSVRLMFKLHDELPSDILTGHRDRFRDMFIKLKTFYDNVRPLQYFADLIQVPHLPESAPNFTSKVDFGCYIPPIVVVPPEPNAVVDNLIDINTVKEQNLQTLENEYSAKIFAYEDALKDKENVIRELNIELTELRKILNSVQSSYQEETQKLGEEISVLNAELIDVKEISTKMRVLKDELELKLQETPTLLQKVTVEEGKAKASEEKFVKLKNMYTQIRDEHIQLLRQHAETTKDLNKAKNLISDITTKNECLKVQLDECQGLLISKEEFLRNKNLDSEVKIREMFCEYENLSKNFEELQQQHNLLQETKNNEILLLREQVIELSADSKDLNECKSQLNVLEKCILETNEQMIKNKTEHESVINGLREDLDIKIKETVAVKNACTKEIETKNTEVQEMKKEVSKMQLASKEKEDAVHRISKEKATIENELQDWIQRNSANELKLNKHISDLECLQIKLTDNETKYQHLIRLIMTAVIKIVQLVSFKNFNNDDLEYFENIFKSNKNLRTVLDELKNTYKTQSSDENDTTRFITKVILTGHHFSVLKQYCILLYSNTTNIDKGNGKMAGFRTIYQPLTCHMLQKRYNRRIKQRNINKFCIFCCSVAVIIKEIVSKLNFLTDPFINLFEDLNQQYSSKVETEITAIITYLDALNLLVDDLRLSTNASLELGDLVENELKEMDKAIEEAAEKIVKLLSSARSGDSGIKLEVNEKILDACTNLMKCIKVLIMKSKILQEEIVSLGKGSASAKEFYKRNSQWSEGLISASKSVAQGANLLVEAADKAVSGEPKKSFEIIVAAQEIAACTAQLVIASKVKAPRESIKLVELTKASRNVSQATGAVVATVKDCNQQLEHSQDMDFSKLTSNQAKTMEMDIHVKVLELEQALQVERLRLSAFRRQNYQNTDD